MNYSRFLDATWKRLLVASLLSGAIIFSISTFAESTYITSQKLQIESARQQHCKKWAYQKTPSGERQVSCAKWDSK
jgi:hypothetical protein